LKPDDKGRKRKLDKLNKELVKLTKDLSKLKNKLNNP